MKYISFELKDENNRTFLHILLEASNIIDDISKYVPWHVNKNCNILVDLNSLKPQQDFSSQLLGFIKNLHIIIKK